MSDDITVHFEQVNVLIASVCTPKGRAEVRLWCDGHTIKLVTRFEQKVFQQETALLPAGWIKHDLWLGQDKPYGLTFEECVTKIRQKLNE